MRYFRGLIVLLMLTGLSVGCSRRALVAPTALLEDASDELGPAWSPDGRFIAYERVVSETESHLWVMDLETETRRQLTHVHARNANPAWSPDGKTLAFDSTRNGERNIHVIDVSPAEEKSGTVRPLTAGAGTNRHPAWSPDGTHIAFDSDRGGCFDIVVMSADGTDQTVLTGGNSHNTHPTWSPDGKLIAFDSGRAGSRDIWMMNVDGALPRRLTTEDDEEWDPQWTPDGKYLLYVRREVSGRAEFYQVYRDGRGVSQVLGTDRDIRDPAISPDGKTIAFAGNPKDNYDIYTVTFETRE